MSRGDKPEEDKAVIDRSEVEDYPPAWGKERVELTQEEYRQLGEGKAIAIYDGEYVTIVELAETAQDRTTTEDI